MSRKRLNVAASLLKQAKARAVAAPDNVVALSQETALPGAGASAMISALHSRIDETPDPETGASRLRVIIPGGKKPEVFDLSRLLVQPDLARFLTEGFRHWAATISFNTRLEKRRLLNSNIGDFLATLKTPTSPSQIDRTFWSGFVRWLDGPRRKNGQPWAQETRADVLGVVRLCIEALRDHPEHGAIATHLMERSGFPFNSWPGRHTKIVPTPVLSQSEKREMLLACLGEVAALQRHLDERDTVLETGRALLEEAQADGRAPPYRQEIGVCAARLTEAFPDRLATYKDLQALDPVLRYAVNDKHGMLAVRRLLYATFRDIVPFVLLIGVKTAFNPDTILSLTWTRVQFSDDRQSVTFLGVKNRATDLQVSVNPTEAPDDQEFPAEPGARGGLADLLDLLRRLTERTRAILANPDHADRLFIGVPVQSGSVAKAFQSAMGSSCSTAWQYSFKQFIADHGLTPFTLKMLRPTEGEEEWRRTGDLLAVRDLLGQKNIDTTRRHYTSDGMRRENQERVAETQALYHRWASSKGRIDPRKKPEQCRSAATPGFGCLDPFDSLRPGQRKGRLCDAYGECPDCPLAQAWPNDPKAVVYYLALSKAIHDARLGHVSARQWAEKWPPILRALNSLLAEIPPEVRAEASRFRVKLKLVG